MSSDGKGKAIASLVCGILSIVLFGPSIFVALMTFGIGILLCAAPCSVLGVSAIMLSVAAKKEGFSGGQRVAGMVLGIVGTVLVGIELLLLGCLGLVACIS